MEKRKLMTPDGMRDYLFEECVARGIVEEKITGIFENYGYSEVITTPWEFYDVFNLKSRNYAQESMYKMSDFKGRLLVARPDCTIPIARLVSTRLRGVAQPIKLYYSQNIFRVNPKDAGRDDQIWQSGIEIIGGDSLKTDEEVLTIAVDLLSALDMKDFRLELCDVSFFREFISDLNIDEETQEYIRTLIRAKNLPDLENALKDYDDSPALRGLRELPTLFGGIEVFDKAEPFLYTDEMKQTFANLKKLFVNLCKIAGDEKITIDLGLVGKVGYYTGILFKGYIQGYGMSILSGGRYDNLISEFGEPTPATGLAVNINAATNAMMDENEDMYKRVPDVLVYGDDNFESLRHCKQLVAQGLKAMNSSVKDKDDAFAYAKAKKIRRIDIVNNGTVETVNL